jgi:F-type H+-transporting ATPase subunit alpha
VSIFAGTKGYLDDLPVGEVRRFEQELLDYVRTRHGALLAGIRQDPKSDVPGELASIVETFKDQFLAGHPGDRPAADPTATDAEAVGEAESNKTLATE